MRKAHNGARNKTLTQNLCFAHLCDQLGVRVGGRNSVQQIIQTESSMHFAQAPPVSVETSTVVVRSFSDIGDSDSLKQKDIETRVSDTV